MSKPTFAARCLLAEQCLPDAPYRAMLTKLHSEMLTALAEQPAQSTPFAYVWTNSKGQAAYGPIPHDIYSSEPLYKAPQPAQKQELVADALYFAQWTAAKKDLSDYICVGSLTLAGIEDGEYGQSEIDSLENTIEALQEKLVTGADHKKVPLLAYIGALNSTSPPAQREDWELGTASTCKCPEELDASNYRLDPPGLDPLYTFKQSSEPVFAFLDTKPNHNIKENT
jgi:hypothetical protein